MEQPHDLSSDITPNLGDAMGAGRAFARRAVRYLAAEGMRDARKLSKRTATEITLRSHAETSSYFADFALVDPGLVHLPRWRPESPGDVDEQPERFGAFGAVGRAG